MHRGIVTVEDSERHRQLLREAGECAAGADAELVLVALVPESTFDDDVETMESIGDVEGVEYGESAVVTAARTEVKDIASAVLSDLDVPVTTVARVVQEGEQAEALVRLGTDHDCDHAFVVGKKRSPTGKAVFGDEAQQVLLTFDGYVTVHLE